MVRSLRNRVVPSPHNLEKTAPKTTKKVTATSQPTSTKTTAPAKVTKLKAAPKRAASKNTRSATRSATPEVEDEPELDEEREDEEDVPAQAVVEPSNAIEVNDDDEENLPSAPPITDSEQKNTSRTTRPARTKALHQEGPKRSSRKRKNEREESHATRPKPQDDSNPYYNQNGDMAGPTEEKRVRSLRNETAPEQRVAKPSSKSAKEAAKDVPGTKKQDEQEAVLSDEEEADEQHEDEQQSIPAPDTIATPARSSWGASLSGLFRTPMSLFRRSAASEARGAIPAFASSATPSKISQSIASSQKKKSPKKLDKAKRQAAIEHQTALEKRKAATEAIVTSARSAEDVEEEIRRRVEEQLASMNKTMEKKSKPTQKRKRAANSSEGGPGSTPHPKKSGPKRSLAESSAAVPNVTVDHNEDFAEQTIYQTPIRNAGFGLFDDDSPEEEEERPAKRVKKNVNFKEKFESLTTPPQNSDLARIQARRPPNTKWMAGDMFREPPKRGILKDTGYVAPDYVPNEFDNMDAEHFEFDTPHQVRESIPSDHFNFAGSFAMPELSDSSSDEDSFLTDEAGSTPMPKKSKVFNFDSPSKSNQTTSSPSKISSSATSGPSISGPVKTPVSASSRPARTTADVSSKPVQETPPAAPQPAHATLPAGSTPSTHIKESPHSSVDAARARAQQHTPKQSSRLRESTNASTSPPPASRKVNGMAVIGSPMRSELEKTILNNAGNVDPTTLSFPLQGYRFASDEKSLLWLRDEFDKHWTENAESNINECMTNFQQWQQQGKPTLTVLGF